MSYLLVISDVSLTVLALSDREVADGSSCLLLLQSHRQNLPLQHSRLPDQEHLHHRITSVRDQYGLRGRLTIVSYSKEPPSPLLLTPGGCWSRM